MTIPAEEAGSLFEDTALARKERNTARRVSSSSTRARARSTTRSSRNVFFAAPAAQSPPKPRGSRKSTLTAKSSLKAPNWLTGGSPKVSSLMVEWLIGVVLIGWTVLDGRKSYQTTVHNFFWRFFSWSMVFFVLALLMRGKSSGKVAVMFGALLDVVLVVSSANNGSLTRLADVFEGKSFAGSGGASSSTSTGTSALQQFEKDISQIGNTVGSGVDNAIYDEAKKLLGTSTATKLGNTANSVSSSTLGKAITDILDPVQGVKATVNEAKKLLKDLGL